MKARYFSIFLGIALLLFATLACSINIDLPRLEATEPTTMIIDETAPAGDAQVSLSMGAGELNIAGGSTKLVEGTIITNIDLLQPVINRTDNRVGLSQEGELRGLPPKNLINQWNLKLGGAPTALTINAGAYRGSLDFGGIPLTRLEISDGASSVNADFSSPNPEKMSLLIYRTGASSVTLTNLGNANFEEMVFDGGAGSSTLDFSGTLRQEGRVTISGGASSTKVIIPKETLAEVRITGTIKNISTAGTWTVLNNTYKSDGSGPGLIITVDVNVGNLELIRE